MLLISSLKTAGITAKSQSTVSWDSQSILKTLAWQILLKSHDVIQIHPFLSFFFFFFLSLPFLLWLPSGPRGREAVISYYFQKDHPPQGEGPSQGEGS